jgi:hypothetical protein
MTAFGPSVDIPFSKVNISFWPEDARHTASKSTSAIEKRLCQDYLFILIIQIIMH